MPVATFDRTVDVSAPAETVWRTITDVARVAGWVKAVGDVTEMAFLERYQAVLADRLGPFRLAADLDVVVTDVVEGARIEFVADGEDRQVASRIKVEAGMHLEGLDAGTRMTVSGRYEVTGKVATLGASMIRSKAEKMLDEFFTNAARELG